MKLLRVIRKTGCLGTLILVAACGGSDATLDTGTSAAFAPSTGDIAVPAQALGAMHHGQGTFYGATGEGNCSFDASPDDLMVAAMNHVDYAGSAVCGETIAVTGPNGTVTVRITDQCPECAEGDVDLSAQAFAKIADPSAGRVAITWQAVAADVQGPLQYRYKEGSSRYWTAIQVRNHRLPITGLEILPGSSTTWIRVERTDYNYFVYPAEIATGPLQVRVTALGGATLQDTLPEPQGGLIVMGAAQLQAESAEHWFLLICITALSCALVVRQRSWRATSLGCRLRVGCRRHRRGGGRCG